MVKSKEIVSTERRNFLVAGSCALVAGAVFGVAPNLPMLKSAKANPAPTKKQFVFASDPRAKLAEYSVLPG